MRKPSILDTFIIDHYGTPGCWLWQAYRGRGYGIVYYQLPGEKGKLHLVHRLVYKILIGEVPAGLQLDHLCNTAHCGNPAHLKPTTAKENVLRSTNFAAINARKTECPRGHPYTNETARYREVGKNTWRECKICARIKLAERKAAAK